MRSCASVGRLWCWGRREGRLFTLRLKQQQPLLAGPLAAGSVTCASETAGDRPRPDRQPVPLCRLSTAGLQSIAGASANSKIWSLLFHRGLREGQGFDDPVAACFRSPRRHPRRFCCSVLRDGLVPRVQSQWRAPPPPSPRFKVETNCSPTVRVCACVSERWPLAAESRRV